MSGPLWTIEEVIAATGGTLDGPAQGVVTGISIDTRTLEAGDLFVPLSDKRDGHDFVAEAFAKGAAAALVSQKIVLEKTGATLIRVTDPLAALRDMARAARQRLSPDAVVVAVTGSVGKTGTKDMLRAAFSAVGKTHAAQKSFNNHWGVPLTLAATPREVDAAIYEIGMNHAGEITPLTEIVQPHIAIVTAVEPVHLEFFDSIDDIARAKAEIFDGLKSGGIAVLNADNPYFALLKDRAAAAKARILTFGSVSDADVRLASFRTDAVGSEVTANIGDREITYRLEIPGAHVAQNSLAVLASLYGAGRDIRQGARALAGLQPGVGRGARHVISLTGGEILVIDESYNANPASMRAALSVLGAVPRQDYPTRVAILGDMLELGEDSSALHAGLYEWTEKCDIDLVFCSGPHMAALFQKLPESKRGAWANEVEGLTEPVLNALKPGQVLMIKGSLGSRMAHVLAAIRDKFDS